MGLSSDRSRRHQNLVRTSVTHLAASRVLLFCSDVICDLLLNSCTLPWNLKWTCNLLSMIRIWLTHVLRNKKNYGIISQQLLQLIKSTKYQMPFTKRSFLTHFQLSWINESLYTFGKTICHIHLTKIISSIQTPFLISLVSSVSSAQANYYFPRRLFLLNSLNPKSDQHLMSPYRRTAESQIRIMRMKEMITDLKSYDC